MHNISEVNAFSHIHLMNHVHIKSLATWLFFNMLFNMLTHWGQATYICFPYITDEVTRTKADSSLGWISLGALLTGTNNIFHHFWAQSCLSRHISLSFGKMDTDPNSAP